MPRLALALSLLALACPLAAQSRDTLTYASPALATLVGEAARDNAIPSSLRGYRANVESEIALGVRRDDGVEAIVRVEQVATTLRWTAGGGYEQHIVGYRAQQSMPGTSMLTALPNGWIIPVLYGERLFAPRQPRARRSRRGATRPLVAVHPLARDRERYYQFTGGDTVVTLRVGARSIPVVRMHVEPRDGARDDALLFAGDIDVDAARHVVVRMRGHYVLPIARGSGVRARVARAAVQAYAFIEIETSERDGAYWLPSTQRIEFQASIATFGDARGVVRIVSRLRDVVVDDSATVASNDTRWRLTRAASDSIDAYRGWRALLGAATGATHADDFDDVAPNAWRATGAPTLEPFIARGSDLVRFDRVQGLFTGAGARLQLRDAMPGVTLRAVGGWAWAEHAARGRLELERAWIDSARSANATARGAARWSLTLRAARSLDLTNDFRDPLDSGSTLGALLGSIDDYDYVDRRTFGFAIKRTFAERAAVLRVETARVRDARVDAHLAHGISRARAFRANRGVDAGAYSRMTGTLELHPDVAAEFVRPGVGARLTYEMGDGDLTYERAEVRVVGRVDVPMVWPSGLRGSSLAAIARADGGIVTGDAIPAQQLLELGGAQSVRGYGYKAFAGDRATLARAALVYTSPWLRAPIRVARTVLPGISPGLSVGIETGGAWATSDAARAALVRLAAGDSTMRSRPSDGLRASIDVGVRLFGGAIFLGAARPVDGFGDRRGGWRFVGGTVMGVGP